VCTLPSENPAQLVAADAIKLIGQSGMGGYVDIDDQQDKRMFKLDCFPNPFNSQTTIRYELDQSQNIVLLVYNILGQQVDLLFNGYCPAGQYQVTWPTSRGVPSTGLYFLCLRSGKSQITHKLLYLK